MSERVSEFIVLYLSSGGGPSLTLRRGKGARMFVQLVDPQPPGLPPGIALVELPSNCYIDVEAKLP